MGSQTGDCRGCGRVIKVCTQAYTSRGSRACEVAIRRAAGRAAGLVGAASEGVVLWGDAAEFAALLAQARPPRADCATPRLFFHDHLYDWEPTWLSGKDLESFRQQLESGKHAPDGAP